MADRKRNPWRALAESVLFRVAFAGFILLEFVVFVLLLWGISRIAPEDNDFVAGALVVSVLISPFAIGGVSDLLFQRFTRAQYVLAESEKWMAERHETDARRIRKGNRLRRWAVWLPTAIVIFICAFFDQTLAIASHVFHPGSSRLVGYHVSIPLTWTLAFTSPYPNADQT